MEPVRFAAQGGDLERNATSDGKPMQITKEINGLLLTCGYIADDSSKHKLLIGMNTKYMFRVLESRSTLIGYGSNNSCYFISL